MTVAQLLEKLEKMPQDAVVLMEAGGGIAAIDELELVPDSGPGAPAEVILHPSLDGD
jgi:hypothetical protein